MASDRKSDAQKQQIAKIQATKTLRRKKRKAENLKRRGGDIRNKRKAA
jgi:hypothetical protein